MPCSMMALAAGVPVAEEALAVLGRVVETLHGQGVDQARSGPGVRMRMDVAAMADVGALRRWLKGAPDGLVVLQICPMGAGACLVVYRDAEQGEARG